MAPPRQVRDRGTPGPMGQVTTPACEEDGQERPGEKDILTEARRSWEKEGQQQTTGREGSPAREGPPRVPPPPPLPCSPGPAPPQQAGTDLAKLGKTNTTRLFHQADPRDPQSGLSPPAAPGAVLREAGAAQAWPRNWLLKQWPSTLCACS